MAQNRYKENPFLGSLVVPMRDKQISISPMGKNDHVLVNQATGEISGTHVTTYRRVDNEQFIKLFTNNIALTFDLTSAGIKSFGVLLWAVQHNALGKDIVILDMPVLEDFLADAEKRHGKAPVISRSTFLRGLRELEKAKIIAKTLTKSLYFINPSFVFNGDRIAFTTLLVRKRVGEDTQTIDMLEQDL